MRILTLVLVAVTIGSGQGAGPHPIALVGGTVVDVSAFGSSTTDIRDAIGTMPGISLHTELGLLVKACLTRQALAAAAGNVGTVLGWRDVGQIRAGFNADLLVLDADPTVDVANVKTIERVMLAGSLIDRASLLRAGR